MNNHKQNIQIKSKFLFLFKMVESKIKKKGKEEVNPQYWGLWERGSGKGERTGAK